MRHTPKKHVNTAWLRKYSIVNLKDHRKFFAALLGKINYNGLAILKLKKFKRNNKLTLKSGNPMSIRSPKLPITKCLKLSRSSDGQSSARQPAHKAACTSRAQ